MALFGFKKRNRILDLTEKYKQQLETATKPESNPETAPGTLGIQAAKPEDANVGGPVAEERKKKLANRLMDMTKKTEDLSNQIYHLQQRIELLERKAGIKIE